MRIYISYPPTKALFLLVVEETHTVGDVFDDAIELYLGLYGLPPPLKTRAFTAHTHTQTSAHPCRGAREPVFTLELEQWRCNTG